MNSNLAWSIIALIVLLFVIATVLAPIIGRLIARKSIDAAEFPGCDDEGCVCYGIPHRHVPLGGGRDRIILFDGDVFFDCGQFTRSGEYRGDE